MLVILNDDRLYCALDALLPHKEALEIHLKERLGEPFNLEYELLLLQHLGLLLPSHLPIMEKKMNEM